MGQILIRLCRLSGNKSSVFIERLRFINIYMLKSGANFIEMKLLANLDDKN